ncbi:MAG: hypothetical protein ACRCVX_12530 [Shewanella sp.]
MNNAHRHELWALWLLAVVVIGGSIYIATLSANGSEGHNDTHGIVIGGLMAALPMLINAIRNIGQAQTMQSMAEQLGNSSPVNEATLPLTPDMREGRQ